MRRSVFAVAVLLVVATLALGAPGAGAQTYPPAPTSGPGPGVSAEDPGTRVVNVHGTPQRVALGRTGASNTVPLVAIATGALLLGVTLVGFARRRRGALEFWAPSGS